MVKTTPLVRVLFGHCRKAVGLLVLGVFLISGIIATVATGVNPKPVSAATSSNLNFQARLQNAAGGIVADGYYNIEFKMYTAVSGGTAVWTEDYYDSNGVTAGNDNRVRVKNGYISVNLGSQTAFSGGIDWSQEMWLTMNVGGTTQTATPTYDGEMNPRLKLTAVPYAFKAGDSATLGGVASSGFIQNQLASAQSANIFLQSGSSAGNPTVQIQQASGQTGDLLQYRNSSGTLIGKVDSSANIAVNNFVDLAGTGPFLNFGAAAAVLNTRSAGNVGLVIKGQSSQTGDLIQLQDNSGNPVAGFSGTGQLYLGRSTGAVGSFKLFNATNANTVSVQSGTTTTGYTLTLPTALGSSGNCLTDSTGTGVLAFSACASSGGATSVGALSNTSTANGGSITAGVLTLNVADGTNGGLLSAAANTQTIGGAKTFSGAATFSSTINTNTFSGSALTFGSASTATIQSAASQALTLTGNAASTWSTSAGALTITSAAAATWSTTAGNLTLNAGGGTIVLGTNTTTLQKSGTAFTFDLNNASNSTLTLTNGGAGIASLSVEGGVTIGSGQVFTVGATAGASTTCTGGQFLQNQVTLGGITTGGTCASGGTSGATSVGAISNTSTANGGSISAGVLTLNVADGTNGGLLSAAANPQTIGGAKTFSGAAVFSSTINTNTFTGSALTFGAAGTATVQSAASQALNITGNAASTLSTTAGALTITSAAAATWSTTAGNLTLQAGSGTVSLGSSTALTNTGALTITGGTTLSLVSTGANAISLDSGTTGNVNVGTGANAKAVAIGNNTSGTTVTTQGGSTSVAVANAGATVKTNTNSGTALQVQNSNGNSIFTVDTSATTTNVNSGFLSIQGSAPVATPTLTTSASGGSLTAATYQYAVSTKGANGAVSQAAVSSPTNVVTTGSASRNTITWSAANNSVGYRVWRTTNGGTTWFYNDVSSATTSIIDNGSTYTWSTSGTPSTTNATAGLALSTGTSLILDAGTGNSSARIVYDSTYSSFNIANYNTSGTINFQADSYYWQDTTGYNSNFFLVNTGAATFQNRVNSTTGFQILPNGSSTAVFNADTTNSRVGVGINAPAYKLDVVGDINTSTGYRVGGTAGVSTTCSGGNFLQNQVVVGGITTGGTCASGGTSGATSVGALSNTSTANGGSISAGVLTLNVADGTNGGLLSAAANSQTIGGNKTFSGTVTGSSTITGTTINGTTGINTGAGAGTNRIDVNGNLVNIGTITSGLINGQTISSSASFTGGLAVAGAVTLNGTTTIGDATTDRLTLTAQITGGSPIVLQGATDNSFATTLALVDPTANNTITLPNASGTVAVSATGNIALSAAGQISLTGTVGLTNGGTNSTSYTTNGVIYNNGTSLVSTGTGSTGQCIIGTTGSAPTWGTCGTASSLQDAYNTSGATNPQIQLSNTNGGLKIRDAASSTIGNLFQIQNSGGTATYFGITSSAVSMQNTSGVNTFSLDSSTGHIKIFDPAAYNASNYADIYYSGSEAVFAATTGTTRIGNGNGNILLQLTNPSDVLIGSKTATLSGAYSGNDFSFNRTITGGANSVTGNIVKIENTSTGSSTFNQNLLYINENSSSTNTGNLILAAKSGTTKFSVDVNGNVLGNAYGGLGAVSLTSAAATNLTLSAGTTGQTIVKAATNGTASFEIQNSSAGSLLTADSTNSRIYIGEPVADANSTLLVLDSYTTAGDPTGINGAMYYNTSYATFRCYENGAWADCLSRHVISLTSDQTDNTGACTFANAGNLAFAVTANRTYRFHAQVQYTSAATTTGIGLSATGPTSTFLTTQSSNAATTISIVGGGGSGNNGAGCSPTSNVITSAGNSATMDGIFLPTASGTLQMTFATEINASAVVLKAGSTFEWW